jgi:hypothetical protein
MNSIPELLISVGYKYIILQPTFFHAVNSLPCPHFSFVLIKFSYVLYKLIYLHVMLV